MAYSLSNKSILKLFSILALFVLALVGRTGFAESNEGLSHSSLRQHTVHNSQQVVKINRQYDSSIDLQQFIIKADLIEPFVFTLPATSLKKSAKHITDELSLKAEHSLSISKSVWDLLLYPSHSNFRYASILQFSEASIQPHYRLFSEIPLPKNPILMADYQVNFGQQLDWLLSHDHNSSRLSSWKDSNLIYRFIQQV